jgi:hypothetical protein
MLILLLAGALAAGEGRAAQNDVRVVLPAGMDVQVPDGDAAMTRVRKIEADAARRIASAVAVPTPGAWAVYAFFPDAAYTVLVSRVTAVYGGAVLVEGTCRKEGDVQFSSVIAPDGFRHEVHDLVCGKLYQAVSLADGSWEIREYEDGRRLPARSLPPVVLPAVGALAFPDAGDGGVSPLAATTIDLMMVFDTSAQTWANANGGITAFANAAVAKMNTALSNSDIDCSLNLVYVQSSSYTYSGNLETDLYALRDGTGNLSNIAALRNTYGADLVGMVVDTGSAYGTTGIGFIPGSSSGNPSAAFTVCSIRAVNNGQTMTHEVGHNLGCGHSKNQASQPGPSPVYTYAAGWYFTGNNAVKYHTIMAYNSDGYGNSYSPCNLFSSPLKTYQGVAAGHSADGDNARTIRNMKVVVAAYRTATVNVVAAPQMSPASGTVFASSLAVSITCATAGATIRYTTNGAEPTSSSAVYGSPLTLTATTTLKAKAFKSGMTESASVSATYYRRPANDAFADAAVLSGVSGSVVGSSLYASKEVGEPDHSSSGGASVWWKWTAPATGSVTFDTVGSSFDTMMAAYTGISMGALTRLAQDDDGGGNLKSLITFAVNAGTLYHVAVDGWSGANGSITLNWSLAAEHTPTIFSGGTFVSGGVTYFRIRFDGKAGKTYVVQRADSLTGAPAWTSLSPPVTVAVDGVQTFDVAIPAGNGSGFFKVMEQ